MRCSTPNTPQTSAKALRSTLFHPSRHEVGFRVHTKKEWPVSTMDIAKEIDRLRVPSVTTGISADVLGSDDRAGRNRIQEGRSFYRCHAVHAEEAATNFTTW